MQFGSKETTRLLDDEGSTASIAEVYRNGLRLAPIKVVYKIRHRILNHEVQRLIDLLESLLADNTKLEPRVEIERTRDASGYYYAVECYTKLEG